MAKGHRLIEAEEAKGYVSKGGECHQKKNLIGITVICFQYGTKKQEAILFIYLAQC